ncbi:hypothetical protein CABS03_06689 [Colletotrichum abscissum]|uniref:Uncharacterized protein n=2 Tax=Colletotrichum acutatum species complex TaxID=2707335 RepID=A0A9P9XDC7_9PEZI|nr:hypothetical protein CABS02_08328 [Colletotrichum abscissum]KAK0378743.1 hypothetical protein CLIM01_03908 [Colletotrichum limetticola]
MEDHQHEPTRMYPLQVLEAPPSNCHSSCSRTLPVPAWTCSGATVRLVLSPTAAMPPEMR